MISIEYLRQFRLGEYAVFDFVVSFLGIFLLSPLLSRVFRKVGLEVPLASWMLFTIPIGILSHLLVGSITPMTRDFISYDGHIFLKIFITILILLGIKGVRKIK